MKKEANDPGFTNGTNGRDLSVFYCDSCNVTRRLTRIRRQSGCPSREALERDLPSPFMDSNIHVKYRHLSVFARPWRMRGLHSVRKDG